MKFSLDVLGLKKSQCIKTAVCSYALFFKLVGVTCSGLITFFSRVLIDQKYQGTFLQHGKDYFQVSYIK